MSNDAITTGIHTMLRDSMRISSAYRKFGNSSFESYGWETFLWEGNRIIKEFQVLHTPNDVVDLHTQIKIKVEKGDL